MSQSDSAVEFRHRGDAVSGQLVGLPKEAVLRQNDERLQFVNRLRFGAINETTEERNIGDFSPING